MAITGIFRKVDDLGRIVLPKELRKVFKIKAKDPLELSLYFENKVATGIIVKKCNQDKNIEDIENDLFEIINQVKNRWKELGISDKACSNVVNLLEQVREELRST